MGTTPANYTSIDIVPLTGTPTVAAPLSGTPVDITPQQLLLSLFDAQETVYLRVFPDRKDADPFPGQKYAVECGKFSALEPALRQHNALHRGIFFVVNAGGQDDKSITRINAQFMEMDDGTFEEQRAKIDAFPLPPSLIVRTRKSLHTYWLITGGEVSRFRPIQKALVKHFGGDPACVNESRVLRLPGFDHCKQEHVPVQCILFHPERRYTQAQLAEHLPVEESPFSSRKAAPVKGTEKGLPLVLRGCDFMRHCEEDAASLPEHDWYAMITNLAGFEGGAEAIHRLSALYPGYSREETAGKLEHFLASGTRPILCKTIAEKGFVCPRFASGACTCRSPAALACDAPPTELLQQLIAEAPVTGDLAQDLPAASQLIRDTMYAADQATVFALLQTAFKEHFSFKAAALKTLESVWREAAKKHAATLQKRRHKVEDTVQPWYEPSEGGLRFLPGVLAQHMADTENVFYAAEQHYAYSGGVYSPIPEMEAQHMCQQKMIVRETTMHQIIDAEKQWTLLIGRDIRELNANPFLINCRNGLYDVLEDRLLPHTPDIPTTVQLNVSYTPDADCPRFRQFLLDSMEGDEAQVALLQEMLGYFLIPVTAAQKCFVLVGAAGAGKSVLLRVLNELLLGRGNVSNVSWQALNERFKPAELFGKLANIFADLPTKNIDDNGIFKALVGEDFLTVEKKNKNPFSFQCSARLLFSCNSIPRNYGDRSEGFYRRLIIIRFSRAVPEDKRDPELIEKFRAEADGIFLYALEGLRRLLANHYRFSETAANRQEVQQYREASDSVLSFARESCEFGEDYAVGSTELFNAYRAFCEEDGLKPYSQKAFITGIISAFPAVARGVDVTGRRRILKGVRLRPLLS